MYKKFTNCKPDTAYMYWKCCYNSSGDSEWV